MRLGRNHQRQSVLQSPGGASGGGGLSRGNHPIPSAARPSVINISGRHYDESSSSPPSLPNPRGTRVTFSARRQIAGGGGRFTLSNRCEDSAIESTFHIYPVVLIAETFGEHAGRCRSIHKILLNLGVEEDTELKVLALDTRPVEGPLIEQYVARTTGHVGVPVLFVGGKCLGDYTAILGLARNDKLRSALESAGVGGVVPAIPLPTLEENIYGYPKGLVEGQEGNYGRGTAYRRNIDVINDTAAPLNVLLGACGSSASDKIPELIERCVAKGWNVKLLTTSSGEHFFKSFGMSRIMDSIGAENVYRDEDEWSFEYDRFGMPVRACHLALRKWADVLVVAPITCNSMAKAVAGIGDNLLSSTLVAWEFQKKKLILCPACNADMWNNPPTQRNVEFLKEMGAEFMGPRVDTLTNGQVAIGCMEHVQNIVDRLEEEEAELLSGDDWYWRRARRAASMRSGGNETLWGLVARAVDDGLLDVNGAEPEYGNSLLHLAAGAESMIDEQGKFSWGDANHKFLCRFIELGANVNATNKFDLTPMHVAISAGDASAVQLLLENKADCSGLLVDFPDATHEIRVMLEARPKASELKTKYYFTYGSLKRGFPNHEDQAVHMTKFVGTAITVDNYPLVVPLEPSCSNPSCPYLHKQASLVEVPGMGKRVTGEVFEVTAEDIRAFDKLEMFRGITRNENAYNRRIISVEVGDRVLECYVYFATSHDPITMVEDGKAEYINEYDLDMSKGELKPEFRDKFIAPAQDEVADECRRFSTLSCATGGSSRQSKYRTSRVGLSDRSTINRNFLARMSVAGAPQHTHKLAPPPRNTTMSPQAGLPTPSGHGDIIDDVSLSSDVEDADAKLTALAQMEISDRTGDDLDKIVEEELMDTSGFKKDDISSDKGGDNNHSRATVRFTVSPNEKIRNKANVQSVDMRLTKTPVGLFSMMMKEKVGTVQQTINTCNLASITLALETLGIHCSVNDIFLSLMLPVDWVVGNGLTLAQVFDVLVKMCGSTNEDELLLQGVYVKCYHMDEELANVESLHEYLRQSLPCPDSVIIANFNTKIARNSQQGGGHFSVISGYDEDKRMVSIADVHPQKYGEHWACSINKLFRAMTDKDSSSKRARGMISLLKSPTVEPTKVLDTLNTSVNFRCMSFGEEEQLWLSCWGNIRGFDSHTNMGGLSALALALSGFLSDEDMFELGIQRSISADEIAWTLQLDICALLNAVVQPDELAEYSRGVIETLGLNLKVYSEEAKKMDLNDAGCLSSFLRNHIGGGGVALVLVDINKTLGFDAIKVDENSEAAALDHGVSHWCVLVSVQDNLTAIIADPRAKSYGRLWKCKLHNLINGLKAEKGSCRVVILRSQRRIYQGVTAHEEE